MKSNKYPGGKIIVKIIGVCSYLERHWNPNQIEIYEPSDVCLGQHIASVVVAPAVSFNFRTLFSISYFVTMVYPQAYFTPLTKHTKNNINGIQPAAGAQIFLLSYALIKIK